MSIDICWLTLEQYVGQCIGEHSNDMSPNTPANTWPVYQSILGQYGECQLLVEYQLTIQRGHTSQLSYNITCVFMSERGSWVSVSHTRYCIRGFENSFCSVVRVNPGQPQHVNLLDNFLLWFYACHNVRLFLNTSQRQCYSSPYFFKESRTQLKLFSNIRLVKAAKAP